MPSDGSWPQAHVVSPYASCEWLQGHILIPKVQLWYPASIQSILGILTNWPLWLDQLPTHHVEYILSCLDSIILHL